MRPARRPDTRSPALPGGQELLYELRPVNPLPVLDLSLSVESRFLSRRALTRMKTLIRSRRLIGVATLFAVVAYALAVLAPVAIGRVCGIVCVILWLPGIGVSFALLRFDVLVLVLRSYDYWFSSCVTTSTYLVLGLLVRDTRALASLGGWIGIQLSMLVDANIRGVKPWTVVNAVGFLNCAATWAAVSLDLIDCTQDFTLLRYKAHDLPATAFVTSGLVTVMAIALRNVYRKRHVFRKRADRSIIKCVSYRVNLRFEATDDSTQSLSPVLPLASNSPARPEYEKPLLFTRTLDTIDARATLLPQVLASRAATDPISAVRCCCWSPAIFTCVGVTALLGSAGSVFVDAYAPLHPGSQIPIAQTVAAVFTVVYCGRFALHYQRQLFQELCTTFDVLYLSAQLLVVHISVCDFFAYEVKCVLAVFVSWLWCVWVVCLDAAPPVVRHKLGLRKAFAVTVVLVLLGASGALTFLLFFSNGGTGKIREHVMWETRVLGHLVQFRLVPIFFNSFVTAFVLWLRVLWRLVANEHNVLLLLDGAVAYENFLLTARNRNSRRWGSIARARRQNPSIADTVMKQRLGPQSDDSRT